MVLTTALDNNKIILVLVGIITSVVGAVYYLTVIKTIYFEESDYFNNLDYKESLFAKEVSIVSLSNLYSITISVLNLAILSFILIPNEILNLCNLLSVINFSV